jgi:riboflavin kinase / FMN adenylyltransferase
MTTQVVAHLQEITDRRPTYLAIGVFDGVHRGHQALLQRMSGEAHAAGVQAAALTFFPHPQQVIRGQMGRFYLCPLEERLERLTAVGLDLVIPYTFDQTTRNTRAADFIAQLQQHFHLRQLWSGDFGLGYRREGNAAFLSELGQSQGFTVHEERNLLLLDGERVSSTRVRQALAEGYVAQANALLGRPYHVGGLVEHGDQRGRLLNFPTANLGVWAEQIIPANGVYATYATVGGKTYMAATNIGVRPTVDGQNLRVEAHLLDFDADIYGEWVSLTFMARVRPEQKFTGIEALRAQIGADVQTVRRLLMSS